METVEEGQKRIEFVHQGKEDRISALTDCLLLEILSRLPSTEDAIRTGTLSKRWNPLWTSVSTLIFTHAHRSPTQSVQNPKSRPAFVSFVDKTLAQCRQLKLKKFIVCTDYDTRFECQFHNWIRYAISCNVEELDFWFLSGEDAQFVLDQFFFNSTSFTYLRLSRCILNPTGATSWINLRSLFIIRGKLNEDSIENILSGSPVLETLVLQDCYGYRLLNITSKSVKNLVFSGYNDPEHEYDDDLDHVVEINAPNILSLTIRDGLLLRKLLLLNVSSLVEANLDYRKHGSWEASHSETEEEMLKGLILKLFHVNELKIGSFCRKVLSRLDAKGFDFPSNIKFC